MRPCIFVEVLEPCRAMPDVTRVNMLKTNSFFGCLCTYEVNISTFSSAQPLTGQNLIRSSAIIQQSILKRGVIPAEFMLSPGSFSRSTEKGDVLVQKITCATLGSYCMTLRNVTMILRHSLEYCLLWALKNP